MSEPNLSLLIENLSSFSEEVRIDAAQQLGQAQDAAAVEPLIKALKDKSKRVRIAAAEALSRIGDPRAIKPLCKRLKAFLEDEYVCSAAARALGAFPDPQTIKVLSQVLNGHIQEISVRVATAQALGQIGGAEVREPLTLALANSSPDIRRAAAQALAVLNGSSSSDTNALDSSNEPERSQNADALIHALADSDSSVRYSAIQALTEMKEPRAIAPLLARYHPGEGWNSPSRTELVVLSQALGELGDVTTIRTVIQRTVTIPDYTAEGMLQRDALYRVICNYSPEILAQIISDKDEQTRRYAARVLEENPVPSATPSVIEHLSTALTNDDPGVQATAARILGKIKASQAIEPLIHALGSLDDHVRVMSASALRLLGEPQWGEIIHGDPDDFQALIKLDDSRIPVYDNLRQALSSKGSPACKQALSALGYLRTPEAIEILVSKLDDRDIGFRCKVLETLGETGSVKAIEPLAKAIADQENQISEMAVKALGNIDSDRARELVRIALHDERERLRIAAIKALKKSERPEDTSLLLAMAQDSTSSVRAAAIGSLNSTAEKQILPVLLKAINDPESNVRATAAQMLGSVGGENVIDPLIHALQDPASSVGSAAARALGQIGDERAIEPLIAIAEVSKARLAAQQALLHFDDPRIIKPLSRALGEELAKPYADIYSTVGSIKNRELLVGICRHALIALRSSLYNMGTEAQRASAEKRYRIVDYIKRNELQRGQEIYKIALEDSDAKVREIAERALQEIKWAQKAKDDYDEAMRTL